MDLELERCPPELGYINTLKKAGIVLSLSDYREMAALNRDDLALWNEAEYQREADRAELRKQELEKQK
jgi:hypothetical protein